MNFSNIYNSRTQKLKLLIVFRLIFVKLLTEIFVDSIFRILAHSNICPSIRIYYDVLSIFIYCFTGSCNMGLSVVERWLIFKFGILAVRNFESYPLMIVNNQPIQFVITH